MAGRSSAGVVSLSEVSVRPVVGGAERAEWGRLMDAHHYLGFRCLFGGGVRHVAVAADGRWLALLGWQCGAFKVKVRDAWIGWAPEQQFRRLRLVANNTRFLILPEARTPRLASRALSLSVRRLSSDMEAALGHPALLAETFVDPSRFKGTCYRASNWVELGETRGYAKAHGRWVAHGQPKRVFVRPLAPGAAEALRGLDEPAPPSAARLRSLYDFLRQVPECRKRRGLRHWLATVLTLAAAAKADGRAGADGDRRVRRPAHAAPAGGGAGVPQPVHRQAGAAVEVLRPQRAVGGRQQIVGRRRERRAGSMCVSPACGP